MFSELYADCYDEEDFKRVAKLENECKLICEYIIDYGLTLRQCATETGIPKTTIQRRISNEIRYFMDDEYCQIQHILKENKKYKFCQRKYWR